MRYLDRIAIVLMACSTSTMAQEPFVGTGPGGTNLVVSSGGGDVIIDGVPFSSVLAEISTMRSTMVDQVFFLSILFRCSRPLVLPTYTPPQPH